MDRKKEKLALYEKLIESDTSVTKDELRQFIDTVISIIKTAKGHFDDISRSSVSRLEKELENMRAEQSDMKESISSETKQMMKKCKEMCDEVMTHKPKDGESPDVEKLEKDIVEDVLEEIKPLIPTVEQVAFNLPKVGKSIRDSLELLQGDERLDKSAIKGLDEEFNGVREALSAGVTNLRIQQAFKYLLKTEAPVGAINGSNTTYTVKNDIFAVLAMSINGETIAQLPNYTIAGKSIVFSSALPAVYSGKDFEIKYI